MPEPVREPSAPMFAGVEVEPDRRPRPWGLLALVALVLAVAAAGVAWLASDRPGDDGTGTTAPVAAASGPPGTASSAVVAADLTLVVSQHVVLDDPSSTVTVTMPDRRSLPSLSQFDPEATGIEVLAGDTATRVPTSLAPGDTVTVTLPHSTLEFDLVYTATGAVVRSLPSAAHRAAALVNPLSVGGAADAPVTTSVPGATNMGCVSATATTACGGDTADGWAVTRRPGAADAGIVAQVDLPR